MSRNARFFYDALSLPLVIVMSTLIPARADTFIIADQTEILSITQLGSSDSLVVGGNTCQAFLEIEDIGCRFLISRNDGASVAPATGDQILNLSEMDGIFLSDNIETHASLGGPIFAEVAFYSQPDGSPAFRCDAMGGCQGVEKVGDQVVGTIFWTDGGSDAVVLRSGAEAPAVVPEPATGLLFGMGCVGLIGYARRRRTDWARAAHMESFAKHAQPACSGV